MDKVKMWPTDTSQVERAAEKKRNNPFGNAEQSTGKQQNVARRWADSPMERDVS